MRFSFDTETALIAPGRAAPPLTCLTFVQNGVSGLLGTDGTRPRDLFVQVLRDGDTIVGHNVVFDLAVMCAEYPDLTEPVFGAIEDGRVECTQTRAMLIDIARGQFRGHLAEDGVWVPHTYHLDVLARRYAGVQLKKDGFRLHYAGFRGAPPALWRERAVEIQDAARPRLDALLRRVRSLSKEERAELKDLEGLISALPEECLSYPVADAVATDALFLAQENFANELIRDMAHQMRGAWALHLTSVWGLRTDAEAVAALERETQTALAKCKGHLIREKLVRPNGSRDTKRAADRMTKVCEEAGLPIRQTKGGGVSLDADACKASGDDVLLDYAELTSLSSVISKDCKALAAGTRLPVHTRFGMADTGRTTSSKPNVQNWRGLPGIRECFRPRPGRVFAQCDYPQLELYTFAEVQYHIFGSSRLGEILSTGRDPHIEMACTILGITYDEGQALHDPGDKDFKQARKLAKEANFGCPGGMGPAKFAKLSEKKGLIMSEAEARRLRDQWFLTWPEAKEYMKYIGRLTSGDDPVVEQLHTRRLRGGVRYTEACNGFFQGLGSDCAKNAMWLVSRASYVDGDSPLFGARTVNFIHDEIISEVDTGPGAAAAAYELARLMQVGANVFLEKCPIPLEKMKPLLMSHWSKDAGQVFDASGQLIPWTGEEAKVS